MPINKFFIPLLFLSTAAVAQPTQIVCSDTFWANAPEAKVIINAEASDAESLTNISIEDKVSGVVLKADAFLLKNIHETGVEVLKGGKHANEFQLTSTNGKAPRTDYTVILTFGTKWFDDVQSDYGYIVGQSQFYCDECGGGLPTFAPNLFCRATAKVTQ